MTLAEIADLLWDAGFEISIGTVKTYLQRIVKKGAPDRPETRSQINVYALPPLEAFAQKWTQDFLKKAFRGSLKAFICTLTGNHDLSEEEKKMLRNLYDDK